MNHAVEQADLICSFKILTHCVLSTSADHSCESGPMLKLSLPQCCTASLMQCQNELLLG